MRQFILFFLCVSALVHAEPPPNVVIIVSDDQGWGDYGFMGHSVVRTPHLDKLAQQSLLFENGYVTAPLCRPSLASMLTGLHPHQHGVVGNDVRPFQDRDRALDDRPVVEMLHKNQNLVRFLVSRGYLAFQSGKWWEGSYLDGGFTHGMTHGDAKRGGRHGDLGLKIGREGMGPLEAFMDEATEAEKPFFIWYAPFLPHTPHRPPTEFLEHYSAKGLSPATAKYFAMCEWFDSTCGQLLQSLERRGIREKTLVVYICDNGWLAASDSKIPLPDGWWPNYAPKSKGSPYELGVRTPVMFSLPGVISPKRTQSFASSLDLFPTIAALCRFEAPAELPGLNLMERQRTQVLGAAYSIHNMTPGKPFESLQYTWLRSGPWKFLRRHQGIDTTRYLTVHDWDRVSVQLFNLNDDPDETHNLASSHDGLVKSFHQVLNRTFPKP